MAEGHSLPSRPPTVDEIVAVMRHTGEDRHGWRLRAMIVVLWRAGLRIKEALALAVHDLDARRGSLLVRIIDGATRGRPWAAAAVRSEFRRVAARAGVWRRFAPHQLRQRTRSSSPARACR